jgi:2-keto-4-pentenoate hydratase
MRPNGNAAHDDRLDPGMERQRALLATAEAEGSRQVGWKAGFGTPAWREQFGLDAPLVGFLLDRTQLASGAEVAIGAWRGPKAEAEIAMRLGSDVPADATPQQALGAVQALAPAIELLDLHPVPQGPAEALSGNVFHRHWITGSFAPIPRGGDLSGLVGEVHTTTETIGPVDDVEAATGLAMETLAEIARFGARHGRPLRSGDVVILGSIIPPVSINPGSNFRFELGGYDPVEVILVD